MSKIVSSSDIERLTATWIVCIGVTTEYGNYSFF